MIPNESTSANFVSFRWKGEPKMQNGRIFSWSLKHENFPEDKLTLFKRVSKLHRANDDRENNSTERLKDCFQAVDKLFPTIPCL